MANADQNLEFSAKPSSLQASHLTGVDELTGALGALKTSQDYSFEAFPTEVRLEILRNLLIGHDWDEFGVEIDLHDLGWGPLYPAIMACNKKIHGEAAEILYGENIFIYHMGGEKIYKLWHGGYRVQKARIPRHYSRLITRVFLELYLKGGENDPSLAAVDDAVGRLRAGVDHAATKLALNELKLLKIGFFNAYTLGPVHCNYGRFPGRPYLGEHCLMPLLKIRATRFELVGDHVSPGMAARLKAIIEGPRDQRFFATRRLKEEEEESDLDTWDD